jgi:hypothetical protein
MTRIRFRALLAYQVSSSILINVMPTANAIPPKTTNCIWGRYWGRYCIGALAISTGTTFSSGNSALTSCKAGFNANPATDLRYDPCAEAVVGYWLGRESRYQQAIHRI